MAETTNDISVSRKNTNEEKEVKSEVTVAIASVGTEFTLETEKQQWRQLEELQSTNSQSFGASSPKSSESVNHQDVNFTGKMSSVFTAPEITEQTGQTNNDFSEGGSVMLVEATKWYKVADTSAKSVGISISKSVERATKLTSLEEPDHTDRKGIKIITAIFISF